MICKKDFIDVLLQHETLIYTLHSDVVSFITLFYRSNEQERRLSVGMNTSMNVVESNNKEGSRMLQTKRIMVFLSIILCLICLPFIAVAQEDVVQITSTGLPAEASQEELLPQGAVVHLQANNLESLLQNIDSLLASFVPEKAVPPEFQPFLESAHPFLAFLTTQMFGQEMPVTALSSMFGIALNEAISLSLYPMDPQKGFVLSVPIADPQGFTGSVQNILRPDEFELKDEGGLLYYYIELNPRQRLEEIYLLTSETRAFFCGSLQTAQMFANSGVDKLSADPLYSKGLEKYAGHDLVLLVSPAFIKAQVPMMKDSFAGALEPLFQQLRAMIAGIPAEHRIMIDMRLRWELGVDDLDQLIEFVEAYSTAFYQVSLDWVVRWLLEFDGLALASKIEPSLQQDSLTLYSQSVKLEDFAAPLPIAEIAEALAVLPGSKNLVNIEGQAPPCLPSRFLQDMLFAAERELKQRGLPLEAFSGLKNFIAERQQISPLTFKTPWTMSTVLKTTDAIAWEEFENLPDLFEMIMELPSFIPLLMSVKMMPETDVELLQTYFQEKAELKSSNADAFQSFRDELPISPPLLDKRSEFYSVDFAEGVTALIFENVYTTRRGYFGYQEHEWINRRITLAENKNGYSYLYDWLPDEEIQNLLMQAEPTALSASIAPLFELLPADVSSVKIVKVLPALSNLLDILSNFERIAFLELDSFLAEAGKVLADANDEGVEEALLEAGLDIPTQLLWLKRDAAGQLYAVLPGGLYYPRPAIMPVVQELFEDFHKGIGDTGGNLAFMAVRPGEIELSSLQRSDALALLVKTVANNVFDKYFSTPKGMELLFSQFMHPKDLSIEEDTLLFTNPLWENILDFLVNSGEPELWELADILVPGGDDDGDEGLEEPYLGDPEEQSRMDMRAIGTALGSYQVDFNEFPSVEGEVPFAAIELPEEYYSGAIADAWGNPFWYSSEDGSSYILKSNGEDGLGETEDDILYSDGAFINP